jgi:hypothetical protein
LLTQKETTTFIPGYSSIISGSTKKEGQTDEMSKKGKQMKNKARKQEFAPQPDHDSSTTQSCWAGASYMAGWLVPSPWNSKDITNRDAPDGQVFGMVLAGFS